MSEKIDQLKEILKDQLNREAKQIEEEVGHWIKKSASVKSVLKI